MANKSKKKKPPTKTRHAKIDDIDSTIKHALLAVNELMITAQGALRFCKSYIKSEPDSAASLYLSTFFNKAINVADDILSSIPADAIINNDLSPRKGTKHHAKHKSNNAINSKKRKSAQAKAPFKKSRVAKK